MAVVIVPTMKPLVKALMRIINEPFDPLSLFASGEEGAWYDPSDLTTLYQDSEGTTPVTTDGDPVGLMLDKSQGLKRGGEKVTNGTFDENVTGWDPIAAGGPTPTIEWASGAAKVVFSGTADAGLRQIFSDPGGLSLVTARVTCFYTGATHIRLQTVNGNTGDVPIGFGQTINLTCLSNRAASGLSTILVRTAVGGSATGHFIVDDISFTPLLGNHASQSTSGLKRLYKTDGTLHWLEDDLFDDAITAAFPDLGTDATVAYADGSGVTILTAQTISGSTNLPTVAETYGVIYLDRAFTAQETADVTAYLESLRTA